MATFQDVLFAIPGLTHYYPLANDAKDVVGDADGIIHGNVTFDGKFAKFNGSSSIELPNRDEFSFAGTASKGLSVHVYQTVDDWTRVSHNNEYIHWAGKGKSGAYEWTFRHYKDGGGGEAPERKRRTSFYAFNKEGNLGAGSFFQDEGDGVGVERYIVALGWGNAGNNGKIQMWKNATKRDEDLMSSYDIYPEKTSSAVFLGTRGDNTGFLVGRLRRVAFFDRALTADEIKKLYDARGYEEGDGSGGGDGGSTTPPPSETEFGEAVIGTAKYPVADVDGNRDTDDLIVYTPDFGANTETSEYGAEASVVNGKVTKLENSVGSLVIPRDGYVLSGHGAARNWLLANATVGATVTLTEDLVPPTTGGGGGGEVPNNSDIEEAYAAAKAALDTLNTKMDALGDAIDAG